MDKFVILRRIVQYLYRFLVGERSTFATQRAYTFEH